MCRAKYNCFAVHHVITHIEDCEASVAVCNHFLYIDMTKFMTKYSTDYVFVSSFHLRIMNVPNQLRIPSLISRSVGNLCLPFNHDLTTLGTNSHLTSNPNIPIDPAKRRDAQPNNSTSSCPHFNPFL